MEQRTASLLFKSAYAQGRQDSSCTKMANGEILVSTLYYAVETSVATRSGRGREPRGRECAIGAATQVSSGRLVRACATPSSLCWMGPGGSQSGQEPRHWSRFEPSGDQKHCLDSSGRPVDTGPSHRKPSS